MLLRRLFVMTSSLALLGAAATSAAQATPPARPVATVRVAEGYDPITRGSTVTYESEPCAVPFHRRRAGATITAYAALVEATAQRCVSSFVADDTPDGHYLRCVEGRCEELGFYWAIYENGTLTCAGIDDVIVDPGDEITFSYESYPTALALATCAL